MFDGIPSQNWQTMCMYMNNVFSLLVEMGIPL